MGHLHSFYLVTPDGTVHHRSPWFETHKTSDMQEGSLCFTDKKTAFLVGACIKLVASIRAEIMPRDMMNLMQDEDDERLTCEVSDIPGTVRKWMVSVIDHEIAQWHQKERQEIVDALARLGKDA